MCLIIHKPESGTVDLSTIKSAMEYNKDGVGYMSPNKVYKWEKIKPKKLYDKINKTKNGAIHFRMATHGKTDANNIHPFRLADDGYLMHNGILRNYAPSDGLNADKSDTAIFCETFCDPIIKETGKLSLRAVDSEIGSNAVAIMSKRKRIARLGSGWNEYNGAWYSNQYAWDCPAKQYDDWRDDDFYDDRARDSYLYHYSSMDTMTDEFLYNLCDVLPLDTDRYISIHDQEVYDELWTPNGSIDQFLDAITPETKLKLISYLIEQGYINP